MSEAKEPLLPTIAEPQELSEANHCALDSALKEYPDEEDAMYRRRRTTLVVVIGVLLATACYCLFLKLASWAQLHKAPGAGAPPSCPKGAPMAHTRNGTYCGLFHSPQNQDIFLGVPYARPPVGDLRFRAPQPLTASFTGVRRATRYSPLCLGLPPGNVDGPAAEDCLYLNVVRPSQHDSREKLPVAVWIHGGGFSHGGTALSRHNLSNMVEEGVLAQKPFVGVSINYRLDVWGFLAGTEVWNSRNTNNGLRDQRLAMKWVRENIEAFGGDPAKVTIWGESAGAASVGLHLTAFGGRDDKLFRAAVMQSGGPVLYKRMHHAKDLDGEYRGLLRQVGCDGASDRLQCLRKVPSKSISAVYGDDFESPWAPAVDNDFIQRLPFDQLAAQEFVRVPIIAGANSDEGTSFVRRGVDTPDEFRAYVERQVKASLVPKILAAYPDDDCFGIPKDLGCKRLGPPYGAQFRRAAAFIGDVTFIAPRRLTCTTWAHAGLPAYCYRFNARPPQVVPERGAGHATEVQYVFGRAPRTDHGPAPPEHVRLAQLMARSWASFFTDADPNSFRSSSGAGELFTDARRGAADDVAAGVPQWPAYDAAASMQFVFDALPLDGKGSDGRAGGNHVEADAFREEGISVINSCADVRDSELWTRKKSLH